MRIGIDIDGVLTDVEKYQIDYGSKYFYQNYGKNILDVNAYDFDSMFGVRKAQDNECWNSLLWDYVTKEPARKFAGEVTQKLHLDGNQIYIITARDYTSQDNLLGEKMRKSVKIWLKENNIYYDELIFVPDDKLDICIKNNIEILIEDKKENVNEVSKQIPVICFDARYNKDCNEQNIYRVYSWYDIYYNIQNIDKRNKEMIFYERKN